MDKFLRLAAIAIEPHVLTFAATAMLVQTATSKLQQVLQSEPTRKIAKLQRNRLSKTNRLLNASSTDVFLLSDVAMEPFFVNKLGFPTIWTRRAILPFVRNQFRISYSESVFLQNLDFATIGFETLSALNEEARRLPHGQQQQLRKMQRFAFFANSDSPIRRMLRIGILDHPIRGNASANGQEIPPTRAVANFPAELQGVRRLFAEAEIDQVGGIAGLWRRLVGVECISLIFNTVELRYYDDGHVVVEKREKHKEQFPALRDVRFLFAPAPGDEVLEDVRVLFPEKKARCGLKQRFKNSWDSFKSKCTIQSSRRQESEAKGGFLGGWQRLKALVRV